MGRRRRKRCRPAAEGLTGRDRGVAGGGGGGGAPGGGGGPPPPPVEPLLGLDLRRDRLELVGVPVRVVAAERQRPTGTQSYGEPRGGGTPVTPIGEFGDDP